jgi:hypothetical protein
MAAGGIGTSVRGGRGLVLVFDLDQTLIDTDSLIKKRKSPQAIKDALSPRILGIIERAERLSRTNPGSIDAFLLLTNNDGRPYVSDICSIIAERFPSKASNFRNIRNRENANIDGRRPLFFDYIMMRTNKHRADMSKSLMDVRIMLSKIGIDYSDLDRRTFFFDDNEHPAMRSDLRAYPDHYIKITSDVPNAGFLMAHPDTTNYSSIEDALIRAERGDEPVPMREAIDEGHGGPSGPPPNFDFGPGAYASAGESNEERMYRHAGLHTRPSIGPLKSAGPGATMPKYVAPPKATSTGTVTSGTNLSGLGIKPKATARPSLMGAFVKPGTPGGKRKTKRRNKKRSTRRR